jgi:aldehyde dehydrogenase (NAD+)
VLGKGVIYKDPIGVVLILSAFNYPLTLITRPLVGALAAGNTVVLKPSEVAAHTAEAIQKLFPK